MTQENQENEKNAPINKKKDNSKFSVVFVRLLCSQ